jgi:hypothetical protein
MKDEISDRDTLTSRPVSSPNGISVFRRIAFRPFRPQAPHVPLSPLLRYPTNSTDYPHLRIPGFAISTQARRDHQAGSGSSSCGLVVRFLLLPTLPRGNAVPVGFRPESDCLERTSTSLTMRLHTRT